MNIKQIKPKGKDSDKYSIQLYRFLEKNYKNGCNVYYISTQTKYNKDYSEAYEEDIPLDKMNIVTGDIWIGKTSRREYNNDDVKGYIDWMYGNSLGTILSGSKEKYTVFANPWNNKKTVIDITDWFWSEYIKVGRCIWDRDHDRWLTNDDKRFTYANKNSRRCNWCGEWQHREIQKKVRIERKVIWK